MNVTNLLHTYWIEKRDIYTSSFRRRSGITIRISPAVMYKMVKKVAKHYPDVQHLYKEK